MGTDASDVPAAGDYHRGALVGVAGYPITVRGSPGRSEMQSSEKFGVATVCSRIGRRVSAPVSSLQTNPQSLDYEIASRFYRPTEVGEAASRIEQVCR